MTLRDDWNKLREEFKKPRTTTRGKLLVVILTSMVLGWVLNQAF